MRDLTNELVSNAVQAAQRGRRALAVDALLNRFEINGRQSSRRHGTAGRRVQACG
jgi:hypothetical protein